MKNTGFTTFQMSIHRPLSAIWSYWPSLRSCLKKMLFNRPSMSLGSIPAICVMSPSLCHLPYSLKHLSVTYLRVRAKEGGKEGS